MQMSVEELLRRMFDYGFAFDIDNTIKTLEHALGIGRDSVVTVSRPR